ncbi:MAG: hypothetical protein ACLQVL_28590 [Terriglobia bacterium]
MRALIVMISCFVYGLPLTLGQYPPLYPFPNSTPRVNEPEHRLPTDQPQQVDAKAPRHTTDAAQLKRDAEEIEKLAQGLPPEMDMVGKGQLPSDLLDRLKSIEKLAKKLRGELSH